MIDYRRFSAARAGGLVVGLAAVLLLAAYWYATATGLAGTFDSYHYLHAAYTLRHQGQLLMPDGSPFRAWPPLFPVVLAALGGGGPVRWLNGLALLGALGAWSVVGYRLLPGRRALALPLLLGLSTPALVCSKFVWSESLFSLLWAGYFLALLGWLRRGGWARGLLATALGCLLPLQRLAGVFLLLGVGLGLLGRGAVPAGQPGRPARLAHLAGTAGGVLAWQLLASPFSLGTVAHPLNPLPIVADYGFVLWRWLLPLPAASLAALPPLLWAGLLALLLVGLRPQAAGHPELAPAPAHAALTGSRMLFNSLAVSLLLLVYSATRDRIMSDVYEAERYLTPLYPAVLVLVLRRYPVASRYGAFLAPVLLVAWVLYQGARLAHNVHQLHQLPPLHALPGG